MKKCIAYTLRLTGDYKIIFTLYIVVAAVTALVNYLSGPQSYNNYLLYKYVFVNTQEQKNLFLQYPSLFFDSNHYGVFLSAVIAPFAILQDGVGMIAWNIGNAVVFLFALYKLPFSDKEKSYFAWLCLQEFITASLYYQFNVALTGLLILSAIYIYERKEVKSVSAIVILFFVKIYGIVGLTQFPFVKNKFRFIISGLIVGGICFVIPMIYSSPEFVIQSYYDWFHSLVDKNTENQILGNKQDISLMGVFRRISGDSSISNLVFLAFGIPLFAVPYIRIRQYQYYTFRLMILSSALLFLVLFSSGSESPTYIITVAGVMIWFFLQKEKTPFLIGLLVLVIIFTCFSTSDLFPASIKKNYIIKYSLKAVPCIIIWFRVVYELLTKDFENDYSF
ncbi:glycosyltransferase family 87 protein [Chryseobacterium culicis]|uniref:DUF2029 domain-containing protein n=1 Tax=Chryseobacterium culicis TaxID=680127 RepID=A0A2S9D1J6_CHRCI|nr:glycosyltransferase family 87 protein [Chryseobacterium culicis]PRB86639.1 hypothetical protein CQ022_10405 [Chryseobacterium culicis]PRB92392.1 hypothetical protein CQ033_04075 [Chryseobacterium culicis]